jgi:hypothetical protein
MESYVVQTQELRALRRLPQVAGPGMSSGLWCILACGNVVRCGVERAEDWGNSHRAADYFFVNARIDLNCVRLRSE